METSFQITLQMVLTVLVGISAQVMAAHFRLPSIVLLLLLGIILGNDGVGILHPQLLGIGLEVIVSLATAIILFEGGLKLDFREVGRVSVSLQLLVTLGTLITLLGGSMAAHWLGEFPWNLAFLYASIVVVTGPTVIGPLVKQINVDKQVATLLEGEGVLIDPVGAILAYVVLDTIVNGDPDPMGAIMGLIMRLGVGGIIGVLGGLVMSMVFKRANFLSFELKNLVVLALLWGLFTMAQAIRSESGVMTTVVAGAVFANSSVPEERLLRSFKNQLTILGVSVLFILLAADLSIASVFALGWGSLFTVLVLMFVVRPINILLCTWNSGLNWRQKLFLSWVAPRGIVSASVASLFAISLTQHGINGGDAIKALVFLTIIMTVFCQGLTASWLVKCLGITSENLTGALIVGCNPLSLLIARFFQERGEKVVIIDTDSEYLAQAEAQNLPVVVNSALDAQVLENAGIAKIGTFIAMTNNGEVNFVLSQRAAEEFNPPRVLAIFPRDPHGNVSVHSRVSQAFVSDLPIKTWNEYLSGGRVKLGNTTLNEEEFESQQQHIQEKIRTGVLVPLLLEREERLQVISVNETWEVGDRIIYLLYDSRPSLLKLLSGSSQSGVLALETLPEVEEKMPMSKFF
ncbi:sodium:proton antiporter [Cylindrospermopsis raciborskii CHAB3438]|jgi:NhaP-type Na+/H+ or K+/H+ antiporter|uniref:cation:proton antiporter n=1 Tax=Cylindrospermopsis TaxID=77021 RepID=UPI000709F4DD|nr:MULTISPECIES: cation:proton antiporter [Cylindrospermopsis]MBU6344265.1 cation:proton antiporter [Cyanobacteria bacterium REEB494]KRH97449.1 sodium:proton antiporter [Cylindrospermopsis sp. CR12]MCH4904085.1 sodium:proton antiporter [Cylindrospermopsis raciborskii CHAB3438]MEB3146000.1 cation:proton antiporter [Cylindrospermopsis raciborskii]TPX29586.1 sodium:proton antiporter [Cylindrospermopsis raciborskii GIHE 2018]